MRSWTVSEARQRRKNHPQAENAKNHSGNVEYPHCRCGRKLENVPGM